MNCQICSKNAATVHVTEIDYDESPSAGPEVAQKHLCEVCAQGMQLPHSPIQASKSALEIWKLLQHSARRARQEGSLACPDCGTTLADFRSKGRLGCPRDYEIFRAHLQPLLQRVHNATEHRGRLPGVDVGESERRAHLSALRSKLEEAIREEAYESAARLRDEIQELEAQPPGQG